MDFWQEEPSELDMAEETAEVEELAAKLAEEPTIVEATPEELEEVMEESAYDLDSQQANTVYNAKLRLEQAKLYEMLINHDLFEGVDASPQAVLRVQNELKYYIVNRLEILLGIRQPNPVKKQVHESLNSVELDFLKALAYKGTKGASVQAEEVKSASSGGPKPLQNKPRLAKINSIKSHDTTVKKNKNLVQQTVRQKEESLPVRAPEKQKPKKNNNEAHKAIRSGGVIGQRNLTEQEAIAIAKEEIKNSKGINKPFHEMTAKEKAQKVKEVNEKYRPKPKPEGTKPFPTADQLAAHYQTQQALRSGSGNQMTQFKELLANALVQGNIYKKEEID